MITIKVTKETNTTEVFEWITSKNIGAWGWTIGPIVPMKSTKSCVTSITFIKDEDAAAFRLSFDI